MRADKVPTEGRLLGLATIGNQSANEIDQEVDGTAMAGMLDLRDILELVNDGLHHRTFSQQELISQKHQHIFHIGTDACNQLHIKSAEQFVHQFFGDVASIGKQFSE